MTIFAKCVVQNFRARMVVVKKKFKDQTKKGLDLGYHGKTPKHGKNFRKTLPVHESSIVRQLVVPKT